MLADIIGKDMKDFPTVHTLFCKTVLTGNHPTMERRFLLKIITKQTSSPERFCWFVTAANGNRLRQLLISRQYNQVLMVLY